MPIKDAKKDPNGILRFSKEVKALRKQKGISQQDMANKMCVSLKTLQNWENQQSCPNVIDDVFKICEILECDVEYLFGKQSLPRRSDAQIHDRTGLSQEAIKKLEQEKSEREKRQSEEYYNKRRYDVKYRMDYSPSINESHDSWIDLVCAVIIKGKPLGRLYGKYEHFLQEYENIDKSFNEYLEERGLDEAQQLGEWTYTKEHHAEALRYRCREMEVEILLQLEEILHAGASSKEPLNWG